MDYAYGIKRFILKEEAEMPSVGYNDVITYMGSKHGENYLPWYSRGKELKVRSIDEMKSIILGSDDVKLAIANLARERTKKYEGHLQAKPMEDKIYGEIYKEASKVIERIASTYNHKTLKFFA